MGPRIFETVQELFWFNCSLVCESSSQQLYGGANGDLLQEDLCSMLCLPGLPQPESLPLRQATADLWLCIETLKHSKAGLAQFVGSLSPGVHKVLFEPSECL